MDKTEVVDFRLLTNKMFLNHANKKSGSFT